MADDLQRPKPALNKLARELAPTFEHKSINHADEPYHNTNKIYQTLNQNSTLQDLGKDLLLSRKPVRQSLVSNYS